MEYKDTIFLPKSSFEMRGNLPLKEPKILEQWDKEKIFYKLREKSKGREKFVLHDGPPYANGHIHMGTALNKILKDVIVRTWVTDFPLFEWDEEEKRFFSMHHPFTSPKPEFLDILDKQPEKVIANAYDLVLNGNEIGGGSIRIHDFDIQMKVFELLGMSKEEYTSQFGFLIEALKYGAPPHGGIAFGLDRLAAVLKGKDVIRDFIAFPKNNSGKDLMIDAPSKLTKDQLKDLSQK